MPFPVKVKARDIPHWVQHPSEDKHPLPVETLLCDLCENAIPLHSLTNHTSSMLDITSVPAQAERICYCRESHQVHERFSMPAILSVEDPQNWYQLTQSKNKQLSEHYSYYQTMYNLSENLDVRIFIEFIDSKLKTVLTVLSVRIRSLLEEKGLSTNWNMLSEHSFNQKKCVEWGLK